MEKKGDDFSATPNDEVHNRLRKNKRRMLHSLHEDEDTRNSIAKVIKKITRRNQEIRSSCIDQSTYDNIRSDIVDIAEEITNQGDRGHFFGGIVRLAAHDFMDFDQNAQSIPDSQTLGPDGCLDFTHPANAGLQIYGVTIKMGVHLRLFMIALITSCPRLIFGLLLPMV